MPRDSPSGRRRPLRASAVWPSPSTSAAGAARAPRILGSLKHAASTMTKAAFEMDRHFRVCHCLFSSHSFPPPDQPPPTRPHFSRFPSPFPHSPCSPPASSPLLSPPFPPLPPILYSSLLFTQKQLRTFLRKRRPAVDSCNQGYLSLHFYRNPRELYNGNPPATQGRQGLCQGKSPGAGWRCKSHSWAVYSHVDRPRPRTRRKLRKIGKGDLRPISPSPSGKATPSGRC